MGQRQDVVLQAFTELAPSYEATIEREVREFCGLGYREFIGYLADSVPAGVDELTLDLASGTALSSLEIAQRRGGRIVALDITPEMQRFGAQNIQKSGLVSQISQVCASGMELPFEPDVFKVVICGLGMHHMDAARLLAEIRRVLLVHGTVILADMGRAGGLAFSTWASFDQMLGGRGTSGMGNAACAGRSGCTRQHSYRRRMVSASE